jgi:hypothetical protein
VLKVLQEVLQYDNGTLLEEATFQRILPPLVLQLQAQVPADWRPEGLDVPAAKEPRVASLGSLDVFGDAIVAALVQMAVTAASDHLVKPLHHEVSQRTFSSGKRC